MELDEFDAGGHCGRGDLRPCFDLGLALLKVGDGEFELLDDLPAALRALAEACPPRLLELQFQAFDLELQTLRLRHGQTRFGEQGTLRDDHGMRRSKIGRQRVGGRAHIMRESP